MEIVIKLNLCRVCLKNVGVLPFYTEDEEKSAADLICSIFDINVIRDVNSPKTICAKCMENIKIAKKTKENIFNSEIILNRYLKTINTTTDSGGNMDIRDDSVVERSLPAVPKLYNCEKCDFKIDSYKRLLYHMRTHADIKLYECEQCGKEFKRRSKYLLHLDIHRFDTPFKCNICSIEFKGRLNLQRHVLNHNKEQKYPCPKCNRTYYHIKGLRQHLLIHNEQNIACEIGGKNYEDNTFLKVHKATAHDNDQVLKLNKNKTTGQLNHIICKICGMLLNSQSSMKLHIETVHFGEKPFQCSYCPKSLTSSSNLRSHIQYHINSKHILLDPKSTEMYLKYKCDECGKGFANLIFLKQHKILHSVVKEHKCPHCGKEFALKVYLNRHVRLVHDTADPRNIVCEIYGKVSADWSSSQPHMLVVHTGETPYHCMFCNSKFGYAKSLRIHMLKKHESEISNVSEKNINQTKIND